MKPVLMQLIILIAEKIFLKFVRIMESLTILWNTGMKKFYWTYQRGVGWPNDYIGPDSMTRWTIEKAKGFTDVGLYRISESVRAYA